MHRLSLASCSRTTTRSSLAANVPKVFARARSGNRKSRGSAPKGGNVGKVEMVFANRSMGKMVASQQPRTPDDVQAAIKSSLKELHFREAARSKAFTEEELVEYLANNVVEWKNQASIQRRLVSCGIPPQQAPLLLTQYALAVQRKNILSELEYTKEQKHRLAYDLSGEDNKDETDEHLSRLFFEWAAHPAQKALLNTFVPTTTLEIIEALYHAADLSIPQGEMVTTRQAPKRKVIMHVGPTNSGKTHNALRALAAAERGVYAGPLRLLAHEIYERLNKGQIIPLGMEPPPDAEPDENTNLEDASGPVVVKQGNEQYARKCNLVTGEIRKIEDPDAGLFSCTVEMASQAPPQMDVAVIDEIQLIADPERGPAWTTAVLGLNAAELHLCGEERAVPLIQELLKDTNDELIINRYERLTPLRVADESLNGDLSKVQKGDCIVTFSRSRIFDLKHKVEKATGLKCAVVYGGLPPEIRNNQAEQFNSLDGSCDVIIGSDAIGMGLNLKIRRMIFDSIYKWNGKEEELLHLSSFKQIAGRAGRFRVGDTNEPGIVTTLWNHHLPAVRKALELPIEPLKYATLSAPWDHYSMVLQALPSGSSLTVLQKIFRYVSKLHPSYKIEESGRKLQQFGYIDNLASELTLRDRLLLQNAPINWRDETLLRGVAALLQRLRDNLFVEYDRLMHLTGFHSYLDDVNELRESRNPRGVSDQHLRNLETMHRMITLYVWLGFRAPVAFPHQQQATEKLAEVEKAMRWTLENLSRSSQGKAPGPGMMHSWQHPRHKEGELLWKRSSVAYSEPGAIGFGKRHATATAA